MALRYKWEKFSAKSEYKVLDRAASSVPSTWISNGKQHSYYEVTSKGTVYIDDSYTVTISQSSADEGYFLFPNKTKITVPYTVPAGKYFARVSVDSDNTGKLTEICYAQEDTKLTWNSRNRYDSDTNITYTYYTLKCSPNAKNYYIGNGWIPTDKIGDTYAASQSAYPSSGYLNGYWYELIGSDDITPASVTFPSGFHAGGSVKITINPSTNLAFGGTISYSIETTSDGTNWKKKAETTDTEVTLYVPLNTTQFGVRVKASDDNGIADDTYVYGNGVTAVTPETSDFLPYSGNIGYALSGHILDTTIASTQFFSLTATINGVAVYNGTGVNGVNAITVSDSTFAGLPENEPIEMTIKAELSSGTVTRVYTFRKFDYDRTNLSGVFSGAAKALRNQTGSSAQILGANIPEEIMKLPAYKLPEVTATPEKVTEGYIFIDSNGELKAGTAASSLRLRTTETRNIRLYTTQSWSSSGTASYSAKVETLTVTPESKDKMCLITAYVGSKDQMLGFWAGISPEAIGIAQTVTTGGAVTGGSGGSVIPGIRCNSYSVTDESIVLKIQENAVGVTVFDTTYAITIKYYE